jgi:ATP-binding cassette, subfamily B, bacterial
VVSSPKRVNHDFSPQSVLLSIDTDFALDGQPDRQWLIVQPDFICVVRADSGDQAEQAIALEKSSDLLIRLDWRELSSIRTVAGVGSGLLQVCSDEKWIDVVRFSNALATRFHKVSRSLERLREAGLDNRDTDAPPKIPSLEPLESLDPPRCASCSLRLATKEESCPRCMEKGQILRQVTHLLRPHRRGAIFLCLLTVLGVGAELIPPKLQQYMVDHILNGKTVSSVFAPDATTLATNVPSGSGAATPESIPFHSALLVVVLSLAFSRVLLSLVGAIKGQISTVIGAGLTSTLREEMVQKLQKLAVAYYDRHQVGSMLSRVAHDSEVLHGLMHQLTGGFLLQSVQLVGVGAMLLWLNPKLAMFTLIPVPLVIAGSWVFWRKVYPRYYGMLRPVKCRCWVGCCRAFVS